MAKPILGYWNIRGLGEPTRYILHYKNVDFVDKRYHFNKDDWKKEKFTLGLDFPNLPYYIDGDIKLTQSSAILRYVARKYGLDGKDDQEKIRVALAEQQITDLHYGLVYLVKSHDYEAAKKEFVKNLTNQLQLWENYLGDRKFLAGDNLTYVDFMAYDVFDFIRIIHESALDGFPALQAFQNRIKNIPELQDYMKSSMYIKWPIFDPNVKFGGGGDPPSYL
ncbi:glutathione S-transferase Mu 1 [Trichonephila clavata]|uniref:glutathione transferase n=1 Tax=Trichonephila clavata TaxID=2740835 RepID=A0A8X6L1B9_TRICU|nr:glutathione S-transferase Mu 1 [Trichonephila clavata]